MNLFEFENERFGDVWNEKTIKELQECKPPEENGTPIGAEPSPCYCWQGTRIPCWFE